MNQSLYDQLGGFTFVHKVISDFYDRVLNNDSLNPFFSQTDMARLIDHQTKFFSSLLGGPTSYTTEELSKVHENMAIQEVHFDTLIELVKETLEDNAVDDGHIEVIAAKLEAHRDCIVSRTPSS